MDQEENIELFENQPIRTAWDAEAEEWYFSIVDVVGVLTEQQDTRHAAKYWSVLKTRLKKEGSRAYGRTEEVRFQYYPQIQKRICFEAPDFFRSDAFLVLFFAVFNFYALNATCSLVPSADAIRFRVFTEGFATPRSILEISAWSIPLFWESSNWDSPALSKQRLRFLDSPALFHDERENRPHKPFPFQDQAHLRILYPCLLVLRQSLCYNLSIYSPGEGGDAGCF